MLRYYRVDLLDFYRGELSIRRLALLVRQLPSESALSRAQNGGLPPWNNTDHRIADLWSLWAKREHPVRAEMAAKVQTEAKQTRRASLKAKYQKLRRTYGLG